MSEHGGMLGAISEAGAIQRELGCPIDEAFRLQERRARKRQLAYRRDQAAAKSVSNVIQLFPRT
jgi:hypothetical protein